MKKIENTALQMIAEASRCPDYGPDMVKSLMKKLDMNETACVSGRMMYMVEGFPSMCAA